MNEDGNRGFVMHMDLFGKGDGDRRASIWRDVNCWTVFLDDQPGGKGTAYYADNIFFALGCAWRYIETGEKPKKQTFDERDAEVSK